MSLFALIKFALGNNYDYMEYSIYYYNNIAY